LHSFLPEVLFVHTLRLAPSGGALCHACVFDSRSRIPHCILQPKCLKLTGSCLLGTLRYNFWLSTPTLSATLHSVIDGQTVLARWHQSLWFKRWGV